jgi:hypothetical protein
MLAWRGKGRDELLTALRGLQGAAGATGAAGAAGRASEPGGPAGPAGTWRTALDVPAPPLAECLDGFWSPGLSPARLRALAAAPGSATPDLLLRMFPPPPAQVRGKDLADVLASAYERLAADDGLAADDDPGPGPGEPGEPG